METTNNNNGTKDINKGNQNLAEIAEQGFTVRNGHNPNKPNPFESPITNNEVGVFPKGSRGKSPSIDADGKEKIVNDEFDNPSDDDLIY